MLQKKIFKKLRCVYCYSEFHINPEYSHIDGNNSLWGVLTCDCDVYPVVAGIVYLKKDTGLKNKKIVGLIKQRKFYESFFLLIDDSIFVKYILVFWYRYQKVFERFFSKVTYIFLHFFSKHKSWIIYLSKRKKSSKNFLVLHSLLKKNLKDSETIVDIGCGNGFLATLLPMNCIYIGIESDFFSLLLSQLLKGRKQEPLLICADINMGIPIKEKSASHIIFLDSFSYLYKKKEILDEVSNVLKEGYVYLIGLYTSTITTDEWGYGISKNNLVQIVKSIYSSFICFDSDTFKKVSATDACDYYSIILKK